MRRAMQSISMMPRRQALQREALQLRAEVQQKVDACFNSESYQCSAYVQCTMAINDKLTDIGKVPFKRNADLEAINGSLIGPTSYNLMKSSWHAASGGCVQCC